MTDREAMQQALEALNLPSLKTMQMLRQRDDAITALHARLKQPEQRRPLTNHELEICVGYRLPNAGFDAIRELIEAASRGKHD